MGTWDTNSYPNKNIYDLWDSILRERVGLNFTAEKVYIFRFYLFKFECIIL